MITRTSPRQQHRRRNRRPQRNLLIETLEPRVLMHAVVTSVAADNRSFVVATFSGPLNASGGSSTSEPRRVEKKPSSNVTFCVSSQSSCESSAEIL